MYCSLIAEYSSWPAVSRTSSSATSSSMTHCLRYESVITMVGKCLQTSQHARIRRRRTFDRRIIFIDEMTLDQLDGQTRLPHASSTDHDKLVLPQELRLVTLSARAQRPPRPASKQLTLDAIVQISRRTDFPRGCSMDQFLSFHKAAPLR